MLNNVLPYNPHLQPLSKCLNYVRGILKENTCSGALRKFILKLLFDRNVDLCWQLLLKQITVGSWEIWKIYNIITQQTIDAWWRPVLFFVTVRAGTAYRKIWRLVNNFFARITRLTVQKCQLFWVIFCIIIFFIELWHILILWLAKIPNGGMPVFTLIATGWRHCRHAHTVLRLPIKNQNMRTGKYSFTKKALTIWYSFQLWQKQTTIQYCNIW